MQHLLNTLDHIGFIPTGTKCLLGAVIICFILLLYKSTLTKH